MRYGHGLFLQWSLLVRSVRVQACVAWPNVWGACAAARAAGGGAEAAQHEYLGGRPAPRHTWIVAYVGLGDGRWLWNQQLDKVHPFVPPPLADSLPVLSCSPTVLTHHHHQKQPDCTRSKHKPVVRVCSAR